MLENAFDSGEQGRLEQLGVLNLAVIPAQKSHTNTDIPIDKQTPTLTSLGWRFFTLYECEKKIPESLSQ